MCDNISKFLIPSEYADDNGFTFRPEFSDILGWIPAEKAMKMLMFIQLHPTWWLDIGVEPYINICVDARTGNMLFKVK